MKEFFQKYQYYLLYILFVLVVVVSLSVITHYTARWFQKKQDRKSGTIPLLRNILNTLWIVLGVTALSFIIAQKEEYKAVLNNFKIVSYLGVLAVFTIGGAALVNNWFKNKIAQKMSENDDPTTHKFLRSVVVAFVYFIGIILGLMAFPSMREVAKMALGGAGVIALLAGIASKEALENMVGGLFIILFKPFKIGDTLKLSDTMEGKVTDITLRHTILRNYENKKIVVPNAILNKEKLVNFDVEGNNCCKHIEIGIAYDSNVDLAKQILRQECEKHPLTIDNRTPAEKRDGKPVVKTALVSLSDSAVILRAWVWARSFDDLTAINFQVLETVKKRYENEGIEIPYAHITVVKKEEKTTNKEK